MISSITPDEMWVIGVFEGEGSIIFDKRNDKSVVLTLGSTDLDVIEKIRLIMGSGTITGPYWSNHSKKPWHRWTAYNGEFIVNTLESWTPYLSNRRKEKAVEAVSRLKTCKWFKDKENEK